MSEREISTLAQAIALLDEWIAAHNQLRRDHERLQRDYAFLLDGYRTRGELLEHFEKLIRAIQLDEEIAA